MNDRDAVLKVWPDAYAAWLFVTTTQFDKPGTTHDCLCVNWWIGVWKDSSALGSTEQ